MAVPLGGDKGKQTTDMTPEEKNDQGGAEPMNGHELDAFLGKAFEEKPLWADLWESIRDVFFPVKLPPLQLTSQPIPVPDRMAVKTNPWAIGIATTINITILCIILFFLGKKVIEAVKPSLLNTNIDISDYNAPKADTRAGGGGGGGDRSMIEANKGKLPQKSPDPITPPTPVTVDHPKLPELSTINVQKDIQLPDNPDMPMIGMKNSSNVQLASAGTGNGAGMGTGSGGGLGSGYGNGYGPGSGGNTGGGVERIGGRVSGPVPIFQPEAEFSDEARRAKYQGVCVVQLIVDAQGNPQNVHVIRTLGMGLDEKAMEAVRKYKFRPAMKDGKTPVAVMITVEVDFHLY
jgi:TonB family protein